MAIPSVHNDVLCLLCGHRSGGYVEYNAVCSWCSFGGIMVGFILMLVLQCVSWFLKIVS